MTQHEFLISMVGFLAFASIVCTGLSWTLFSIDDPNHYTHDLIKVISITLLAGLCLLCLYALYHWNAKMLLHFGWFLIAMSLIFLYTELVLERYEKDAMMTPSIVMSIVTLILIFLLRKVWVMADEKSSSSSSSSLSSSSTSSSSSGPVDQSDRVKKYNELIRKGNLEEAIAYRKARPDFDAYLKQKGTVG